MVFTTEDKGQFTYWRCVDWDLDDHHVRYTRVTPTTKFGHVTVDCCATGPSETEVRVEYSYAALSPEGEKEIAAFTKPVFETMVSGWRDLILAWLAEAKRETA
jgi:hypothetical protein